MVSRAWPRSKVSPNRHRAKTLIDVPRLSTRRHTVCPAPGTPKLQVANLQEAFRKALKDPDFRREFKKMSGFDASPLMPEEQDKAIRELPRDRDVVELFKKLSGADPLPAR